MSSTTNYQSYLPYVFRPVYTYSSNGGFTTTFNLSNIETMSANIASFGQVNLGDSNANVYIGCNAGNNPSNATAFVTSNNSSLGVNSAAGACNVINSVFAGTFCGANGQNISNSFFVGYFAGYSNTSNTNCIFIGASNSINVNNTSNSINIGGNSTSTTSNSWNIFLGTSNSNSGSCNICLGSLSSNTGSNNIIIGNGTVSPSAGKNNLILGTAVAPQSYALADGSSVSIPAGFSNKLFIGSGSNVLIAGDFTKGVVSIGTTNTNTNTCNTAYPNFTLGSISLDVANFARFQKGVAIGCDPASYTLDVNGQFRVTDGWGQLAFSNNYNNTGYSNSFVEMKPVYATGTMTVVVTGLTSSSGYYTAKGSISATSSISDIVRPGLVTVALTDESSSNYYTASFSVPKSGTGNPGGSINVNSVWASVDITASVVTITSTTATFPIYYNITVFPTV
jgi:hypothetical protein